MLGKELQSAAGVFGFLGTPCGLALCQNGFHFGGGFCFALDPDDLDVTDVDTRPDPDVYEDAMQHIIDGERTRDITIAGTDADLVTFLRAKASPEADEKNAEAADREFLGIGYLFSEAEYEAIMAQYNEDGSQSPVYDTETRAFDQVGSKE